MERGDTGKTSIIEDSCEPPSNLCRKSNMVVEAEENIKLSADIHGTSTPETESASRVETELRSDVGSDDRAQVEVKSESARRTGAVLGGETMPVPGTVKEEVPEVESELRLPAEAGRKSETKSEDNADRKPSRPVRFQLKNRKRTLASVMQEDFGDDATDSERGVSRLKRPKRVEFPTISEGEFLDVVDRIEGASLAGNWRDAFELVDFLCARRCDERVMEMKAQLQLEVGEKFEAVRNCERAIKLNPRWWEGHRTHGRALLAVGEFLLAVKAFERAIVINPAEDDLRSELRSALQGLKTLV